MAQELNHRADELQSLGWSQEDISRYVELWDYRQRWGAINLEREDRLFLRKAESALPQITTTRASIKKPLKEKSYYRWLLFYLEAMNNKEQEWKIQNGSRGAWPIILEEELRILDYYEPVLGLPDTLKAKSFDLIRTELVNKLVKSSSTDRTIKSFDFNAPIEEFKKNEKSSWRSLNEGHDASQENYPVLITSEIADFRNGVRMELVQKIPKTLPSLLDTDKPEIPDSWNA